MSIEEAALGMRTVPLLCASRRDACSGRISDRTLNLKSHAL